MRSKRYNLKTTILGAITAGIFLAGAFAVFIRNEIGKPALQTAGFFIIQKGQTLRDVSFNLKEEGIIDNPFIFLWYGEMTGRDKRIKAGAYTIPFSLRVKDLFDLFEKGSNTRVSVLLPPALTLKENIKKIRNAGLNINEQLFFNPPLELKNAYQFFQDMPKGLNLEGFLFPDTYQFEHEESTRSIVIAILNNFNKKFKPEWYEVLRKDGRSIYETVTMASILEKEVRTFEEKKIASGILWKRLALGMPLQVDSSINYITQKKSPAVSYADITIDSPYNTYKYSGLPPGPIANPGEESLEAAVHPQSSSFWFYLSRQDTGETIFSQTYREHTRAKARYLRD